MPRADGREEYFRLRDADRKARGLCQKCSERAEPSKNLCRTTMLQKQNWVCAICKKPPTGEEKISSILHVDHCHQTSKTRGLLCIHCNRGLGGFRDNPDYLYAALEYLRAST